MTAPKFFRQLLFERDLTKLAVILYFVVIFITACALLPDYGIGWDEDGQREKGEVALDYISSKFSIKHDTLRPDLPFADFDQNFYNSVFPVMAVTLSKKILPTYGRPMERQRMLVFHYLTLVVCFIGFLTFYRLLRLRLDHRGWALLGLTLLLLSPRVSFHSFFNVKDSILQSAVTITSLTFFYLVQRMNMRWSAIHGIACGLALAIRPTAIIILALSSGLLPIAWWSKRRMPRLSFPLLIGLVVVFLLVASIVTVICWPFLWEDPVNNFAIAWGKFSSFPWSGEILLFNSWLESTDLPAYYLPAWIAITTPLLISVSFLYGCIHFLANLWRSRSSLFKRERIDFLEIDTFQLTIPFGAILAIVALGSVIYDSWRHIYFVYPAIVYFATLGIRNWFGYLKRKRWNTLRVVSTGVVSSSLLYLFVWCVWAHPHQYNYFNPIAGDELERRYSVDYWGISFQDALRRAIDQDTSGKKLRILVSNYSGKANARMLPKSYADRLETCSLNLDDPDYFISNFRFRPHQEAYRKGLWPYQNPVFNAELPWGQGKVYEVYRPGPRPDDSLQPN